MKYDKEIEEELKKRGVSMKKKVKLARKRSLDSLTIARAYCSPGLLRCEAVDELSK